MQVTKAPWVELIRIHTVLFKTVRNIVDLLFFYSDCTEKKNSFTYKKRRRAITIKKKLTHNKLLP